MNRPSAIAKRKGAVAPTETSATIPRVPSAFINTTIHCPDVTGQVSVFVPVPDASACHHDCEAGSAGAPPSWGVYVTRYGRNCRSLSRSYATPFRYLSASARGAMPMKTPAGEALEAVMRTVPSAFWSTGHRRFEKLRSTLELAIAYEGATRLPLPDVRYPDASRWVLSAHIRRPPPASRPIVRSARTLPMTTSATPPARGR